jgi:hypothetical protein
MHLLKGMQK